MPEFARSDDYPPPYSPLFKSCPSTAKLKGFESDKMMICVPQCSRIKFNLNKIRIVKVV